MDGFVVLEGWLEKKVPKKPLEFLASPWQQRYFVLRIPHPEGQGRDGGGLVATLSYYSNVKDAAYGKVYLDQRGTVSLYKAKGVSSSEAYVDANVHKNPRRFDLVAPRIAGAWHSAGQEHLASSSYMHTYALRAGSHEDADKWILFLRRALAGEGMQLVQEVHGVPDKAPAVPARKGRGEKVGKIGVDHQRRAELRRKRRARRAAANAAAAATKTTTAPARAPIRQSPRPQVITNTKSAVSVPATRRPRPALQDPPRSPTRAGPRLGTPPPGIRSASMIRDDRREEDSMWQHRVAGSKLQARPPPGVRSASIIARDRPMPAPALPAPGSPARSPSRRTRQQAPLSPSRPKSPVRGRIRGFSIVGDILNGKIPMNPLAPEDGVGVPTQNVDSATGASLPPPPPGVQDPAAQAESERRQIAVGRSKTRLPAPPPGVRSASIIGRVDSDFRVEPSFEASLPAPTYAVPTQNVGSAAEASLPPPPPGVQDPAAQAASERRQIAVGRSKTRLPAPPPGVRSASIIGRADNGFRVEPSFESALPAPTYAPPSPARSPSRIKNIRVMAPLAEASAYTDIQTHNKQMAAVDGMYESNLIDGNERSTIKRTLSVSGSSESMDPTARMAKLLRAADALYADGAINTSEHQNMRAAVIEQDDSVVRAFEQYLNEVGKLSGR